MEQTNIANDLNQPVETSPINSTIPKPKNLYKYLFFITLIILLGFIIFFYTNTNNQKANLNSDNANKEVVKITPTEIVEKETNNESEDEKKEVTKEDTKNTYKAVSVQDDKNQISKLILIDQDKNEIIIKEGKYWGEPGGYIAKPSYSDFIFSSDNNYLYFYNDSGWEGGSSYLYNILDKKVINLNMYADTKGFLSDSKYFYACAEGGMMSGGAIIKDLDSLNNIFIANDHSDSYKCQYNKNTGDVLLTELDSYGYDEEKKLSQHKFSEKTGVLTKIK